MNWDGGDCDKGLQRPYVKFNYICGTNGNTCKFGWIIPSIACLIIWKLLRVSYKKQCKIVFTSRCIYYEEHLAFLRCDSFYVISSEYLCKRMCVNVFLA